MIESNIEINKKKEKNINDTLSKYKVGMVSLGCDKNRVDSEIILGKMSTEYESVCKIFVGKNKGIYSK